MRTFLNLQSFEEVKNNFRILKNWKIDLVADSEYKAQITCDNKNKVATLYDWPDNSTRPKDFYVHECMHAALKELKTLRGTRRFNAEEDLIQDIGRVILYGQDDSLTKGK